MHKDYRYSINKNSAYKNHIAIILTPKYFISTRKLSMCCQKIQWKFRGWRLWLFEQYDNTICHCINNFTWRLIWLMYTDMGDQRLISLRFTIQHDAKTRKSIDTNKSPLSDVMIYQDSTLIWLNIYDKKVPNRWWISYTRNVLMTWTRKDSQISNTISLQ